MVEYKFFDSQFKIKIRRYFNKMKRILKDTRNYLFFFLVIILLVFLTGCNGFVPTLSDANDTESFILPEQTTTATIDTATNTVEIEVAPDINLTNLVPKITVSPDATISPPSGIAQDFSSPVTYTVTAEGGSLQDWIVTVVEKTYKIRELGPAGGYIFYIDEADDYPWTYLEAAPESSEWVLKKWGSYGTYIGGTDTAIGTGMANTTAIVNWLDSNTDDSQGDVTNKADRAAYLCYELTEGGYTDWFLPSKEELELMYTNLRLFDVGGFIGGGNYYWSSSEYNGSSAWFHNFSTDYQSHPDKVIGYRVRAIRAF